MWLSLTWKPGLNHIMVNLRCGHCESSINTDEPWREREGCCFITNVWADRINRYLQRNEIRLKAENASDCDLIRWRRQTISSAMEKMAIELPIRQGDNVKEIALQIVVSVAVTFSVRGKVWWCRRHVLVFSPTKLYELQDSERKLKTLKLCPRMQTQYLLLLSSAGLIPKMSSSFLLFFSGFKLRKFSLFLCR